MEPPEPACGQSRAPIVIGLAGGAAFAGHAAALAKLAAKCGPFLHLRSEGVAAPAEAGPAPAEGGVAIALDPNDMPGALAALRAAAPRAAVLFAEPGRTALDLAQLCATAGIPRRIGLADEFAGGVLTDPVRPPGGASEAERHLALAEAAAACLAVRATAP